MPVYKSFECSVHTETLGKLPEYKDDELTDTDNRVTRYLNVSGTEGHRFWIEFNIHPEFAFKSKKHRIRLQVVVDGTKIGNTCLKHSWTCHGPIVTETVDGITRVLTRDMHFKQLTIVEEQDESEIYDKADPRMQSLGRIEVTARVGLSTSKRRHPVKTVAVPVAEALTVHEKAMKNQTTSHGVIFNGSRAASGTKKHLRTYRWIDEPITFVFLYRSQTRLEHLDLIPNPQLANPNAVAPSRQASTSQAASQEAVVDSSDSDEEIAKLSAQLAEKIEKRKSRKRERELGDSAGQHELDGPSIKREKKPRILPGGEVAVEKDCGIVDLTQDD